MVHSQKYVYDINRLTPIAQFYFLPKFSRIVHVWELLVVFSVMYNKRPSLATSSKEKVIIDAYQIVFSIS